MPPHSAAPLASRRVLVLFAHPALARSRVNRALVEAARRVAGVTVHDLYEAYPDFDVDVPREQALMLEHDVVVCQHPLFWYSTPALVKQWFDLVLEHGWAYGTGGDALHGTYWLQAVSTGGPLTSYAADGLNRYTLDELLRPVERTAALCGMRTLPAFRVHGTHGMRQSEIDLHAAEYARLLEWLRDAPLDVALEAGLRVGVEGLRAPATAAAGGAASEREAR
ncbi:General stress protein 14 [Planctomycetes bacterium Pla163]|uniref:General stress protein 14 n=1 Tax=Rohdeia mirabilis TaxID=2528008 RepID=A0A518CZN2_9BACT|nr:General stress protein 14 [Planctomycetes bacterium Pla163]